jgi:hypothetical protein
VQSVGSSQADGCVKVRGMHPIMRSRYTGAFLCACTALRSWRLQGKLSQRKVILEAAGKVILEFLEATGKVILGESYHRVLGGHMESYPRALGGCRESW